MIAHCIVGSEIQPPQQFMGVSFSPCRAVSQDDWSSVIDAQTQETVQQPEVLARQGSDVGAASPASPFSMGRVQQEIGKLPSDPIHTC